VTFAAAEGAQKAKAAFERGERNVAGKEMEAVNGGPDRTAP